MRMVGSSPPPPRLLWCLTAETRRHRIIRLWGNILRNVRDKATSTVQLENERVRITEWQFKPDAETGWHRHDFDYVIVPQTTGALLLESSTGSSVSELVSGKPYFR